MKRGAALKLALLGAFIVGVGWGLKALGVNFSTVSPERVRAFVLSFGIFAPLVYLISYGQPIVPLPASLMTIAGGLAFGPLFGTLAALGGATIRACGEFGVARLLGRDTVAKLLKGNVERLDQQIGKNGFQAVLLIRLIPNVPFDMQNYGLGFSRVRFLPYVLATFFGMMPGAFIYVYLGSSLTDPKHLWKLALAIVLIAGFAVATSKWKQRRTAPSGGRG